MSFQIQKKLTNSTVGLDTRAMEKLVEDNEIHSVARFYGSIVSSEEDVSDFGSFVAFYGKFEAENLITGTKYRAGKMILPEICSSVLLPYFQDSKKNEPSSDVVFALEITVEPNMSKKGGTRFKWGCKTLFEPVGEDSLTRLAASLPKMIENKKKK